MSEPNAQHINCLCDSEPVCGAPDVSACPVCMREFGHRGPHVLCGMPTLSGSASTEKDT